VVDARCAVPWDSDRLESLALMELGSGPDAAEGVTSFLEKRPPRFESGLGPGAVAGIPRWLLPPDDVQPMP